MSTNSSEYNKAYYKNNCEKRKSQIRERNNVAIERNRTNLVIYLQDKVCVDCGYADMRALQFDHLDPAIKRRNIAYMISNAYSWDTILKEMAKCEIVCANCHMKRTCETYGWHKSRLLS